MMLACSINNCTALKMLVRPPVRVGRRANSAAIVTECSQLVYLLYLPPQSLSFTKAEARSKGLRKEQAGPLPYSRCRLCRCQESAGGDPDQRYGENLYFFFFVE